jgi:hypothetical protein
MVDGASKKQKENKRGYRVASLFNHLGAHNRLLLKSTTTLPFSISVARSDHRPFMKRV